MTGLEEIKQAAGKWHGASTLQDPHTGNPDESASQLIVTPLLGGRFVRLDYTWSYQGAEQEGSLLIGYHPKSDELSGHWIDSWHNGNNVMAMTGTASHDGGLQLTGSYEVGDGSPDWGWRIAITPSAETLHLIMFNLEPNGTEYLAVEADYER